MRIFVKFYPTVDTIQLDLEPSATIGTLKQKIFENTNLTSTHDQLKVIVKNVPMTSNDITLWDLSIREDATFHVVVSPYNNNNNNDDQKRKKFRINKPHSIGLFDPLYKIQQQQESTTTATTNIENNVEEQEERQERVANEIFGRIFSFLNLSSLVHGVGLTCRKWRNIENQNSSVWAPLAAQTILLHCSDAQRDEIFDFLNQICQKSSNVNTSSVTSQVSQTKKKNVNFCKQLVVSRHVQTMIWNHVRQFSAIPQPTPQQLSLKFEREKAIRVKREPRPLTEEEEQFLLENDAAVLRKNLRKDKNAREKLRRHKAIQTKKEDIESGVWKVVPQEYIQFDFDSLQQHTFGLHPENNSEGITGFYTGKGKFLFLDREGHLLYLAELEPEEEFYRFKNVIASEENTRDDKQIIMHFFSLFSQCAVRNLSQKQLLDVVVHAQGAKALTIAQIDAIADTLLVTKRYEAGLKVEVPRVEVKRSRELSSPRMGKTIEEPLNYQATSFVYSAKSEDEAPLAEKLSHDNLIQLYVSLINTAHKDDDVSLLALNVLESNYIKKLKLDETEPKNRALVGSLLARAVTQFVKDNNFSLSILDALSALASSSSVEAVEEFDLDEAHTARKKKKKPLRRVVAVVNSEDEKALLIQGLSRAFDLSGVPSTATATTTPAPTATVATATVAPSTATAPAPAEPQQQEQQQQHQPEPEPEPQPEQQVQEQVQEQPEPEPESQPEQVQSEPQSEEQIEQQPEPAQEEPEAQQEQEQQPEQEQQQQPEQQAEQEQEQQSEQEQEQQPEPEQPEEQEQQVQEQQEQPQEQQSEQEQQEQEPEQQAEQVQEQEPEPVQEQPEQQSEAEPEPEPEQQQEQAESEPEPVQQE